MNIKDRIPAYDTLILPYHIAQSATASLINRRPAQKLTVIAVTGTNGKTTTCFMLWKMLSYAGFKTGLITTVAWGGLDGKITNQIEHMTTPDPATLNRRIKILKQAGATHLVLEVTSHALAQHRTFGIPIDIAVMTNVTHEHLDYHKTFARYRSAKCRLFKLAKFGIINADDSSAPYFIDALKQSKSNRRQSSKAPYYLYSLKKPSDFQAQHISLLPSGVKYTCQDISINLNLPGRFNVYNSLAAIAVGAKLGLTPSQISKGLASLESVEGRMNRIVVSKHQDFDVVVDFAHTPDAFEKVFDSMAPAFRALSSQNTSSATSPSATKTTSQSPAKTTSQNSAKTSPRIISLFGGAGRRDESTREARGEIAAKYSDIIIITEDDSRDENPQAIAAQFIAGAEKAGHKTGSLSPSEQKTCIYHSHHGEILTELDRKKAIHLAINLARPGDLVLILGKGHEKTILRRDGPHPFEDIKVTTSALKARFSNSSSEPKQASRKSKQASRKPNQTFSKPNQTSPQQNQSSSKPNQTTRKESK